jgi:antitoxin component YwqK of YwqJK toxin-antitoxin module
MLSAKGDTLNRVDMRGLKQGPWFIHVDDLRGERGYDEQGYFSDDKKEGVWKRFSLDGDMLAIETYRYGYKDGKSVYFNNMGDMLREEHWRAIDPKNPYDTVSVYDVNDPSKVIGKQVIKVEAASYKNGTWTYYNPASGTIDKTEEWVMDKPKNKAASNDDLAPIGVGNESSTANSIEKKQAAKPREVLEFEKKNSGRKKVRVRDGSTGGL